MNAAAKLLNADRNIADSIPFSHHVSDTVIATKNGDYVTTIKLVGRSHFSADADTVERWVNDLNTKFRSFAKENICIWSHMVRRKVDEYPTKHYDNVFCSELNKEYEQSFKDFNLLVNEYYITIVYRPVVGTVSNVFAKWEKLKLSERVYQQEAYLEEIERVAQQVEASLGRYEPERLGIYEHKDRMFCTALEFYRYILTRDTARVPVTREIYANYLCHQRPFFSAFGGMGELRKQGKSEFFGIYDVKDYDDITEAGHLNILMQADCELILTQSFSCISKGAAKGFLKRQKKLLEDSNDVAVSQINELTDALDMLESGKFVMGEHHMTALVFGDSMNEAQRNMQEVADCLGDRGIVPAMCDLALEPAFFSQLPANWKQRTRPSVISSQNWWCFNSLHNFMSGKPTGNPWGSAVTLFKTVSGTPNFFNFHVSKKDSDDEDKMLLGNTLILGQSGGGKTTLLSFLLAQIQDKKPRMVAFDKDRGMEVFIRAIGGHYTPLEIGKNTGFNPLQEEDRDFIKEFICLLIMQDDEGISHTDDEQIERALTILYKHEKINRRLSVFVQGLPNPIVDDEQRPTVAARLSKWCEGNEYGWAFDNAVDELDVTKYSTYGFDVTEFLEKAAIRAPIMMYLIYRTEKMIDGTRFVYVFDEFWKMLGDYYFDKLIKNKLKTIRKQNGICIFATLIQQVGTMLLLENPKADKADYIDGLKLTNEEYEIVKNIPEASRQFLIKQGNDQTSMGVFNLRGMDKEILVLSGTPENALLVNTIIDETGSDTVESWLPEFWKRKGINDFEGFKY
jgi:type IV secretion system protein VirB4